MYFFRLDDASEYMDVKKWLRIETLFKKYNIKPIFGIIPSNKDPGLIQKYEKNPAFWNLARKWISWGWTPALHGDTHKCETKEGGLNPINYRSEFAGVPLDIQEQKIKEGYFVLKEQGIIPEIFFAPSHTFDLNTLASLKAETPIRVISDTIASDVYFKNDFYFLPQQSGHVRALPFNFVTFCYHPNEMRDKDFEHLENFIKKHQKKISSFSPALLKKRPMNTFDKALRKLYFLRKKI